MHNVQPSNPDAAAVTTVADVEHQLRALRDLLCTVRTSGDAAHESAIAAMDTALAHLTRDSTAETAVAESPDNAFAAYAYPWIAKASDVAAFEEQFLRGLETNRTVGASHNVVRCVTTEQVGPIATDGVLLFCTCADCLLREGTKECMYRGAWQPAPLDGTGIVGVGVQLVACCLRGWPQSDADKRAHFCFKRKVENIEKLYQQGPAAGHVEVVAHEIDFRCRGEAQNLVATTLTQSTISDVIARGDHDPTRPVAARALLREAKRLYDSGLVHGHINADNALEVVADDGTIAVAFIGFELTVCEDPEALDAEPTRDLDDQRAVAALFGDVMGVHEVCANPWLRHVMWQLGTGSGYNGLMLLEPGELRPALAVLQKKLTDDAAARGLTGTLLIEAEKALRVLLSTIPRGTVPAELYDPTCGKKNARLLVTVEKALSFLGRRFKTSGRGVELGFPPLVSNTRYVHRALASWRAATNRKHGIRLDEYIRQYPADTSDGEDGVLLFCDCSRCCDYKSGGMFCPGIWLPSPDAPAEEVTVSLFQAHDRDSRARRLFERDVQKLTGLYEAAGTSVRVVAHAFDFQITCNRYHFVATTLGKGTLTEKLRGPLDDTTRIQLARAVLRGANLLVAHGSPHGLIEPDVIVLEEVDGTPKVAFSKLPLPSIQRPFPSAGKIYELWAWATVMALSRSGDPYTVQCEWETEREALAETDPAREAPIPPGTDPWLRHMMRRLLAGNPYHGLLSLEPAELRGTVAEVAGCLGTPAMTALQPLLDVCDADSSTYDEVLATLRCNDAGALTAVDEALSSARWNTGELAVPPI